MCGIAGVVFASSVTQLSSLDAVGRMTARMSRRGPDAEGLWTSDGVVLGHRRLAILDFDARANQPMVSTDGRYAIVFNGEIYNFRELRRELEADGIAFRTTSDTEILLTLFAREGERMLPRLRGMFALAIWDTRSRELFLARDPYGIKPLHYTRIEHGFGLRIPGHGDAGEVAQEALAGVHRQSPQDRLLFTNGDVVVWCGAQARLGRPAPAGRAGDTLGAPLGQDCH